MQIVEVVKPLREELDACLVFPSMPAVMKMNKLGTFSMAQLGQSKSPIAQFMKNMRKSNDNFEESMLKLVRTLPTVLKYLPSQKAQVCTTNPDNPLIKGLKIRNTHPEGRPCWDGYSW